ncbi:hypothetical protein E4631_18875 [Hymenobacter sp. UV11]|uniref:hypothetical protein n=1 Tax=Hymenobacter sp. UV11 TaxID=1849735 RepID=UPI00105F1591|nr:hypothetical protein [Hymenobacter sp. UV11]TDN36475.1 hypothetical protein A8B98_08975 [Hymenobacter sp. UV11]TFZ64579.1 hypothetical protein E4631_18875 [Hymenobacter sp. UV11]
MRRIAPLALGLLLLSPLLARADALDGAFMMLKLLAAVWGLAFLLMLFSLLAYRQPASQPLRLLNYVGVGLSVLLGLAWLFVFSRGQSAGSISGFGDANPFLSLSLPFAAWLGGAHYAATATQPRARQWGVAVAVAGAQPTISALLSLATRWLMPAAINFGLVGLAYVWWLVGLLVSVGVWWLVLGQAQRRQPLGWHEWRPILLVPVLATVLSTVYTYLQFLVLAQGEMDLQWLGQAVLSFFTYGLVSCAVGALAIWLNQRRYQPVVLP